MTAVFLTWYLVYVLLAAYAHGSMSARVVGLITVGMVLGVARFATTLVRVARITALVVGVLAIIGGIVVNGQNVAFLVALALALAASANLAAMLYALFWKRFTTSGSLWSMYGGLGTALLVILFSPVVSGEQAEMEVRSLTGIAPA